MLVAFFYAKERHSTYDVDVEEFYHDDLDYDRLQNNVDVPSDDDFHDQHEID